MLYTACLCKGSVSDISKTQKELTSWEIMTYGHFSALSKSFFCMRGHKLSYMIVQ